MEEMTSYERDEWDLEAEAQDEVCEERKPATSYTIMNTSQLQEQIRKLQKEVATAFKISEDVALSLLITHKWNVQKALFTLADEANNANSAPEVQGNGEVVNETNSGVCSVCLEEIKEGQSESLACGHKFCGKCWAEHCKNSVKAGVCCIRAQCPYPGCKLMIPRTIMRKYLPQSLLTLYESLIVRSYVESEKGMKWCPSAGCEYAIESFSKNPVMVDCKCGHAFCFACAEDAHLPCSCQELHDWNMKGVTESANALWIAANTKPCPNCGVSTQRFDGCNHITCRRCSHEYCWMCKGPWAVHGTQTGGYYTCNDYEKEVKREGKVKIEAAQRAAAQDEVGRYTFHYERYDNHRLALKVARGDVSRVEAFIDDFSARLKYSFSELAFLRSAAEVVVIGRRVLQHSYIRAFYLTDPIKIRLFRYTQGLVEESCDHLHELLHRNLEHYANAKGENELAAFNDYKFQLLNYTAATRNFVCNFAS